MYSNKGHELYSHLGILLMVFKLFTAHIYIGFALLENEIQKEKFSNPKNPTSIATKNTIRFQV